ncbi:hypothetical protein BGY98DRAFT_964297, partial [Russula aff. rugulosa BPL654]
MQIFVETLPGRTLALEAEPGRSLYVHLIKRHPCPKGPGAIVSLRRRTPTSTSQDDQPLGGAGAGVFWPSRPFWLGRLCSL